jgi:acetyl-CoA acetyltransferase
MGYELRDRAAIAGVGMTRITSDSGRSELDLAAESALRACEDAGVDIREVDGFATFNAYGEGVSPVILAAFLGNPEPPNLLCNEPLGGNMTAQIVGFAAMAVATGMARHVLVYKALNGRSGKRIGGSGTAGAAAGDRQYVLPFGMHGAASQFALLAQEYVHRYGVRPERVGSVAVTFRDHAQRNPAARFHGRPITLDDYLASRTVVAPFRLLDCCVEVDGGCALLVTSAERAADMRRPPVLIRATAYGYRGMPVGNPRQQPGWHGSSRYTAPRLWERAGMEVGDVDVAELCDDYTYTLLPQLEEFGWCGPGEAADFCAEGHIRLGGRIPCNTNGGQLSEGFLHGVNQFVEAVRQLRGEAGDRQVADAEVALVSGAYGASAALLRRA